MAGYRFWVKEQQDLVAPPRLTGKGREGCGGVPARPQEQQRRPLADERASGDQQAAHRVPLGQAERHA